MVLCNGMLIKIIVICILIIKIFLILGVIINVGWL